MKLKTVEKFFALIVVPLILIGLHLFIAGTYRNIYYEEHPIKAGSLTGEYHLFIGYAVFCGIAFLAGLTALMVFGIKPEVAPQTVAAPANAAEMSPARKKWYSGERLFFIVAGALLLVNAGYYLLYQSGYAWMVYAILGVACLVYQNSIKEKS
jgi:hypothetical protein